MEVLRRRRRRNRYGIAIVVSATGWCAGGCSGPRPETVIQRVQNPVPQFACPSQQPEPPDPTQVPNSVHYTDPACFDCQTPEDKCSTVLDDWLLKLKYASYTCPDDPVGPYTLCIGYQLVDCCGQGLPPDFNDENNPCKDHGE